MAEKVVPMAETIAKKGGLPVHVLRVVPTVGMLYAGFEPYAYDPTLDKDLEKLAGQYLKTVTEALLRAGVKAQGYQRRGYSAAQVIAFSEELGNCLIVMSTHGRSGVGRWLLGSVADRVIRSAAQPVLLMRAKGDSVPAKG
jgi:nucleotide-binding universal stress UspA family protein